MRSLISGERPVCLSTSARRLSMPCWISAWLGWALTSVAPVHPAIPSEMTKRDKKPNFIQGSFALSQGTMNGLIINDKRINQQLFSKLLPHNQVRHAHVPRRRRDARSPQTSDQGPELRRSLGV